MLMIIFLYLLLFSYQDLKSCTITSKLIIPLIWFAGVHRELDQLWIGLPIYLILLHLNKSEKYIGNGDLDLFFIQFLYLSYLQWFACLQLSCLIGIIVSWIWQKSKIPFIPCMTIGYGMIIF